MNVTLLAVALSGGTAGFGLWLLGARIALRLPTGPRGQTDPALVRAVGTASAVGLAVGLAVRVPVIALLAAGFAFVTVEAVRGPSVPALTALGEAIASWAETVRQELEAGQPLRTAVVSSCDSPPAPIAEPLRRLAQRLDHQPLPQALWGLRAEVPHAALGPVVAALDVAYRRGAGDLPGLMAGQVETTRHRVAVLRDLHAARAKHRRAMVLLLGLFGASVGVLLAVWPTFLAAYRPVTGELVLGLIGLVVLGAVRALVRMSQPPLPPDFFPGPPAVHAPDPAVSAMDGASS